MYTADRQNGVDLIKDKNGVVVGKSFKPKFTEQVIAAFNSVEDEESELQELEKGKDLSPEIKQDGGGEPQGSIDPEEVDQPVEIKETTVANK